MRYPKAGSDDLDVVQTFSIHGDSLVGALALDAYAGGRARAWRLNNLCRRAAAYAIGPRVCIHSRHIDAKRNLADFCSRRHPNRGGAASSWKADPVANATFSKSVAGPEAASLSCTLSGEVARNTFPNQKMPSVAASFRDARKARRALQADRDTGFKSSLPPSAHAAALYDLMALRETPL